MKKIVIDGEIKAYLDEKVFQYNNPNFIESDPISIPHRYSLKEDIEIAGFLAATISWGTRKSIVKTGHRMLDLLGDSPFDFVMSHNTNQLKRLEGFVYRTFNQNDFKYFIKALKNIYAKHGGMEQLFKLNATDHSLQYAIHHFKKLFFELPHEARIEKHVSDPLRGSAAKKINMLLRWLIRNDNKGVDFGLWKSLKPSQLSCPLDVHSGRTARTLGLLLRQQNDATTVEELDRSLRTLDPQDPVKYDFALFGIGISGELEHLV